jgi:hypothetical protein
LAVQENCIAAVHLKEDEVIIGTTRSLLRDKRNGVHKSPELYGAFLLIPLHTPAEKGTTTRDDRSSKRGYS